MKWIQIIIFSLILSVTPISSYGAVATPSSIVHTQENSTNISKKEKPRKKWKKWLKKNKGAIIYGASCLAFIFLIIFGIIRRIRWMWMLGVFGILTPLILGILVGILILIFSRRPKPVLVPEPTPEEKPKPKKDSK